MSRANKLLAALLVVQLAMIAYIFRPGSERGAGSVRFFPDLAAERIETFAITDGAGKTVRLERTDTGWIVDPEKKYPADRKKVDFFLGKIAALASSRPVTRTAASHGRLKVAAGLFNRRLDIGTGDGATRTLYLGTSPSYKTIHARRGEDDEVYLVKDFASWEAPAEVSSWWQTDYVDIEPDTLRAVRLRNPQGEFEMVRDEGSGGPSGWRFADDERPLDDEAVASLLNRLSLITLTDYLGREKSPSYGLDTPLAELVLTTPQGQTTLQVGRLAAQAKPAADAAEEGAAAEEYVLKASDSPFYVLAGSYEVKTLLETTAGSLLAIEPETDTAAGE